MQQIIDNITQKYLGNNPTAENILNDLFSKISKFVIGSVNKYLSCVLISLLYASSGVSASSDKYPNLEANLKR